MKKSKTQYSPNFSFYIKEELMKSLKDAAAKDHRSVSSYLRILIEKSVKPSK